MRIKPPGDAPPWAERMARDIEKDVPNVFREQPLGLADYTTAALPSPGGKHIYSVVYDTTAGRVKVSTGSAWVGALGAHATGWTAATGTADRATFATYTAANISNPPTEAEVQAIADHVQVLSRHMKALIDDLIGKAVIGT